jgi:hypothetical protein
VTQRGARTARFLGVPIDLYLEMQAHNDAVGRDLMIALDNGGLAPELEQRLRPLLGSGFETLLTAREFMREQVEAARAAGQTHVDIWAAYAEEELPRGLEYVDLVEEADAMALSGAIFVTGPGRAVEHLRRWFMRELEDQVLHGQPPTRYAADA